MVDPNAGAVPDDGARDAGAPDGPERAGQGVPRPDESAWTDDWADEQWRSLVAELQQTPSGEAGPGDTGPTGTGSDLPARTIDVAPWVRAAGPRDWPTGPEVADLEEEESHFVPPEPPPVLGRDPLLNLAWGLVALAPLVVLVLVVVIRPFPVLVGQLAGAGFLAGIAILLWRMPHRRDEDDDDPGAVV